MTRVAAKWIATESDRQAVAEGCTFDAAAAERVRLFFRQFLCHSKGEWAGKPFEPLDWQREQVIAPLFGWKRKDGSRRFRKAYIEIPKKNGKSTVCAGLAIYLLVADGEAGAEVYSAAADREQASIVFREAKAMVQASRQLADRVQVVDTTKRLVFPQRNSFYKALSADVPTKEGLNASGLIFDELHAQPNRNLFDTLQYAGAARRQPLFIYITTAGFDRDSICFEQHLYAKGILNGTVIDPAFFAFIAAAEEGDDWKDPATWRKANPSLGSTIAETEFAESCREAQQSPHKENAFKRYRLNIWTEQEFRWVPIDRWDQCDGPVPHAQLLQTLAGRECFAGLDLASTTDLASLNLLFPDGASGYDTLAFFWAPEGACRARERQNRPRLDHWAAQGLIELTAGDVIDYDFIRRRVVELGQIFRIRQAGLDRWNATQLATQLQGDGVDVVFFGQGFQSMSAPTKELEALVLGRRLRHGGNPVLRWNFGNMAVKQDAAGNVKPNKEHAREKIDGVVALIIALGLAQVAPSSTPSISWI